MRPLLPADLKAVIFDLDGTLVDSAADIAAALNHALAGYGHQPVPLEAVRKMIGDGVRALILKAFLFHHTQPVDTEVDAALQAFLSYASQAPADLSTLFDGTIPLLEQLREAGIRIGICTNKVGSLADLVIAATGLSPFIDLTIGGDGPYPPKPDPASLLATITMLGAMPFEAIYIGDMKVDVLTARAANVRFLGVDHGYWPYDAKEASGSGVVIGMSGLRRVFSPLMT
jgi:phosphoglycolate phosphatase